MRFTTQRFSCSLSILAVFLAAIVTSCASLRPGETPDFGATEPEAGVSERSWWHARFSINWPEDAEPSWHIDLLIADRIVSPVLHQYKNKIMLWRFHRRAARDESGHQFSFIFYASPETARGIYTYFGSNNDLMEMIDTGLVIQATYDGLDMVTRPNIEDTSDPNWSSSIKKSWPYYIMGVSQMWLNLIREIAQENSNGQEFQSLEECEALYQEVDESIKQKWQKEGRHALLHHLNAIFGYEPLLVTF